MSTSERRVSAARCPSRRSDEHRPEPDASRRAFSLVELLAVIAVIAVLLALLLPALSAVRGRSWRLKSTANLRQIGQVTAMYTGRYRSYYFGNGGWIRRAPAPNPAYLGCRPWDMEVNWPVLVHDIAPWDEFHPIWISPGKDPREWIGFLTGGMTNMLPTSYRYSNSFVAPPGAWSDPATAIPPGLGPAATRPEQVRFPSSKVLMYDADRSYLRAEPTWDDPRPILFADGSARAMLERGATTPVRNRLLPDQQPRRYHDTPNGVFGRDF